MIRANAATVRGAAQQQTQPLPYLCDLVRAFSSMGMSIALRVASFTALASLALSLDPLDLKLTSIQGQKLDLQVGWGSALKCVLSDSERSGLIWTDLVFGVTLIG